MLHSGEGNSIKEKGMDMIYVEKVRDGTLI